MEAIWFARRAALHCLSQQHPDWTNADLAAAVGGSESFVKKWLARLKQATIPDPKLYPARSHARHTPPPTTPRSVVERILALRDEPPAHAAPWYLAPALSSLFCIMTPKRWRWCPAATLHQNRLESLTRARTHCSRGAACASAAGATGTAGGIAS